MPDDINNPQQNNQPDQGFVRKPVETPILESSVREQISGNMGEPAAKGFYADNKVYFWAIFAGLLIIGILAYFAFKKSPQAVVSEAKVEISIQAPDKVPSSGQAVYAITVQNNDSQALVNMELELAYPDGVKYENSTPRAENISGSLFKIENLLPGQNAAVFVKAKVSGSVNDQKTLQVKLHYKYSNFNSEFVKQQSVSLTLVASDVLIELDGPSSTNNAQLVVYSIKYRNNSDADIKSARIKMNYPEGFVVAQAAPPPSLGADTWDIRDLAKSGEGAIQIQGTFSAANPGESKTASAELQIPGSDGQFFIQNSSVFTTAITSLPLLVVQELSPANPAGVVDPGEEIKFSIRYQNNASVVANGVNISVTLDSKALDLTSIRAEGGLISNNSISWNASAVPLLESLAPSESGRLSFSAQVNKPATKDSSKNLTVTSSIKIKSAEYDSFFPGNQLTLKISSPAAITRILNFESGQMPPQVGRSTTYKVKVALSNSGNDFSSGVLTAYIPLGPGSFIGSSVTPAESGNVQFDASTGKLTWNAGSLPAYAGRFAAARFLEFQITFNPSSTQVQSSPTLVKNISFTAKDLFTLKDVSLKADDITTASLPGSSGFTNGRVQP